jgi:peroxiredoxin
MVPLRHAIGIAVAMTYLLTAAVNLTGCVDLSGGGAAVSRDWNVRKGDALPAFSLPDTEGNTVSLEDFTSQPVLLVRFATWCPPCKAELAAIQRDILPRFGGKGVAIVAVSSGEDAETVRKFVKREGLEFPVLVDEDGTYAKEIGGSSIPRSMIADRHHTIQRLTVGYSPKELDALASELESFI